MDLCEDLLRVAEDAIDLVIRGAVTGIEAVGQIRIEPPDPPDIFLCICLLILQWNATCVLLACYIQWEWGLVMTPIEVVTGVLIKPRAKAADQDTVFIAARRHKFYNGKWEFPGGKIDPGETPSQALQREWKEELNLEINVGYRYGVLEFPPFLLRNPIRLNVYRVFCPNFSPSVIPFPMPVHYAWDWIPMDNLRILHPKFVIPSMTGIVKLLDEESRTTTGE